MAAKDKGSFQTLLCSHVFWVCQVEVTQTHVCIRSLLAHNSGDSKSSSTHLHAHDWLGCVVIAM